ncbi:hypothetical protein [Jannaschia faecimaris]|uniref:hypothetical protein n=1 Tax=Jannaschia faecimaris TaxID=1244108 RepID=UPI0011141912|nr:hypothetical protein [Jannaschia faecimaris]
MNKSLTGQWIGRFDYDDGEASVPFEADMIQSGMTLRAQTVEPNTFHPGAMKELRGFLTGWIVGSEVRLTKTYTFDQVADPEYVGRVDADARRITGCWSFEDMPANTGRFTMTRRPAAKALAERRIAAETEV